jgi:hypothetical protein
MVEKVLYIRVSMCQVSDPAYVFQAPNSPRPSTPLPVPEATAESTAADATLLRQFAAAVVDIRAMESQVMTLWQEEVGMMLPQGAGTADDADPEGK